MKVGDKIIGIKDTGSYGNCDFTKNRIYTILELDERRVSLYDDNKILTYFLRSHFHNNFYNIREGRMDKLKRLNSYGCIE